MSGTKEDGKPGRSGRAHHYGGVYVSVEESSRHLVELRREWARRDGDASIAKGPTRRSKKKLPPPVIYDQPPNPFKVGGISWRKTPRGSSPL